MAYLLSNELNEIRIYDERTNSTQSLFARDPSPQEQLAYERERVTQKRGKVLNKIRQTRLKYGALILDHPQAAATPHDDGYGYLDAGKYYPLEPSSAPPVDVAGLKRQYQQAYGVEWAAFLDQLDPWKLFLLAKAPAHLERVASVLFEGAAEYKQGQAQEEEAGEGETELGN